MIKTFFLLLGMLAISIIARCDTIDFWHVYYNNVKIIECSETGFHCHIQIKKDSMRTGDTISLLYFNDSGCSGCDYLIVKDTSDNEILLIKNNLTGLGGFNVLPNIPISKLLQSNKENFRIYMGSTGRKHDYQILSIDILPSDKPKILNQYKQAGDR